MTPYLAIPSRTVETPLRNAGSLNASLTSSSLPLIIAIPILMSSSIMPPRNLTLNGHEAISFDSIAKAW